MAGRAGKDGGVNRTGEGVNLLIVYPKGSCVSFASTEQEPYQLAYSRVRMAVRERVPRCPPTYWLGGWPTAEDWRRNMNRLLAQRYREVTGQ